MNLGIGFVFTSSLDGKRRKTIQVLHFSHAHVFACTEKCGVVDSIWMGCFENHD